MSSSALASPPDSALAIALRLAEAHPDASLPCPRCAADVKGQNLARHVEKVHPEAGDDPPAVGSDHAVMPLTLIPVGLWFLGISVLAFAGGKTTPASLFSSAYGPSRAWCWSSSPIWAGSEPGSRSRVTP